MRIVALALAAVLAVVFLDPASAAGRHSAATQNANPDRGPFPVSASCEGRQC